MYKIDKNTNRLFKWLFHHESHVHNAPENSEMIKTLVDANNKMYDYIIELEDRLRDVECKFTIC